MKELSGLALAPLREGAEFILYRGLQRGNSTPILAVQLAADPPSLQSLRRLEHEYSLAAELDPAWAAKPLELARHEGRSVLILTDPGAEPLDQILERDEDEWLGLTRFLRIAIGLASAVGHVHRRGLIHKDIKPANALAGLDGHVWLTGFGVASWLPRERQAPAPPEMIAGTLAYMAPEQTGRMNRSIDARSDLYSLGVTLYEMAAGHLPFAARDAMEWVHCHIARQPTPLEASRKLPAPLSAIIMRLLAKTVEERYQTAAGLEADLRRCLADWEAHGEIRPFVLGGRDLSDQLLIPERLYGREGEINSLLAAFDRVVTEGAPELVLVSGYSGIGKSSLVNELHRALAPHRGLFAAGKYDQYNRDIPYITLAQAFQSLVRQLLVRSQTEVEEWRQALAEAVGPNGQLIASLIPEIELIIGKQPPVPELAPQEAQNRFQSVFRRFLGAFARPGQPLILFLDDLQWLDVATLEFLEHLFTGPDVRNLMLIGAYRDNEVSLSHPLMLALGTIRKSGTRMQEIVLGPLEVESAGQFVADALHCGKDRARPLAQLVQEKTGGNPFFAIQFLTTLAEEGLLAVDSAAREWKWNIERIRAKSYTDNVVDLMAAKLRRLSPPAQEALTQLACLGNVAEFATLSLVYGKGEEQLHAALWEAVRAGLVVRLENSYKFLHDRIQQAAYSLVPEERRAEVHLRIGRALFKNMTEETLAEHLFDVANQFNRGASLLADRDEKFDVAGLNLRAGRKAKESAAYASARAYFADGMTAISEPEWTTGYELTFGLWLERAECEFLTGNFEKAEHLIAELMEQAASTVDQAAAFHLKVLLHCMKSENPQAVETALTGLRTFNIDLPAHPIMEQVQAEYEQVWRSLNGRQIEDLIDLPLISNPELQAAMQLLSSLSSPAYFTDSQLYCLHLCRMMNITLQHGVCSASAPGCGFFGLTLGSIFHRYGDGYRFAKLACDLVEKHRFIADQAKTLYSMGAVAPWTQPITNVIEFHRTAFRAAVETGDISYACYDVTTLAADLLLRNDPLDAVWREAEMGLDFARKAKFRDIADIVVSQQRLVAAMQGRTENISTFNDAQFDEAAFEAQLTQDRMAVLGYHYWVHKLKARFLSGDYAEALAAAEKTKALLWAAATQIALLDYYFYAALTVAACHGAAPAGEQAEWRGLLSAHSEQLREWAGINPGTFRDKHSLVAAEIARIEQRKHDAMPLYEEAIQSARENGFVQNEGVAHELAAGFYFACGSTTAARAHLEAARSCFARWGAEAKVRQLEALHPHLREKAIPASPTATIGASAGQFDVGTVVKASQTVSGEIVFSNLIETLMRIGIEHAGAERGLLILFRGDAPRIGAEATIRDGRIEVTLRQEEVRPSDLPESVLQLVIRTRESVILDDAVATDLFANDGYVQQRRPRSLLCLPLVKQAKLVGILYLENNLTPHAFTSGRIAVLELLASQAAISMENASLYSDLQRNEAYLTEAQRLSLTGSFGCRPSTGEMSWSEETFRILGYDRATAPTLERFLHRVHPADRAVVQEELDRAANEARDRDLEYRLLLPENSVKNVRVVAHASKRDSRDDSGGDSGTVEFVGAVMDITEQVQARAALENAFAEIKNLRDQLFKENIALREEIDKASLFEEIVGESPALQAVLARVAKVAPTDSTVLITGETGTGKELFARAIHRRSKYAARAFVSVNCAATPSTLIASELFGHEKGAYTGALQRRLGRFELAEGGTIFLDEIGELPAETQIALLRVLQEREFERVGGSQVIRANVRVITATNRDLEAAVASGGFRKDLYYRLNVFPIVVPPLRERKEDIPLLIEYFVQRYSRKAGKKIRNIEKRTVELLKSYSWPGNIRELQNVIERSVIFCESDLFSVDPSWLSFETPPSPQDGPIAKMSPDQEREAIESALAASKGRVSGPSGAAAQLNMPPSTLESKIRLFKINKYRFKNI